MANVSNSADIMLFPNNEIINRQIQQQRQQCSRRNLFCLFFGLCDYFFKGVVSSMFLPRLSRLFSEESEYNISYNQKFLISTSQIYSTTQYTFNSISQSIPSIISQQQAPTGIFDKIRRHESLNDEIIRSILPSSLGSTAY